MTDRVLQEVRKLQQDGPSADLTSRAKESARRGYETALKQNAYWLQRLQTVHMLGREPGEILTQGRAHRRRDASNRSGGVQEVLPARSLYRRDPCSGAVSAVIRVAVAF